MTEMVLVKVISVDAFGATIASMEDGKPRGCPGLGGWKNIDGLWTTRVKGENAKLFAGLVGQFPTIELDGDHIKSVM